MREYRRFIPLFLLAALCALFAAVWAWTPLYDWLDTDVLSGWLASLRSDPIAPYVVLAAFVVASQLMFPITVLILATAYAFGPWIGFAYGMMGSLLAAIVSYGIGYALGHETFRRIVGPRYHSLAESLNQKGLVAVIGTHLLPVSPFTIINLGAGAVGMRFSRFVLGSVIGLFPGVALITIFERQLENAFENPGAITAVALAAAILVLAAFAFWARRQVGRARRKDEAEE